MLIARVATASGAHHGIVDGPVVHLVRGLTDHRRTGETVPLDTARLLAPVAPGAVYGMAHNTGAGDRVLAPQAFLKPPGTVIGPGEGIPLPGGIGRVVAEAELALVIGARARHRTRGDALEVVLGWTAANDVTARDLQSRDSLWLAGKGFDGFTPLGPFIQTGLPFDAAVSLSVDGVSVSMGSTAELARGFADIIVYLSAISTLRPGDVILTGAPGADGDLHPGAIVSISVGGMPPLVNPVAPAAEPAGLLQYHRKDLV